MSLVKNYSQFHTISYEGQDYIFDPYVFGIGSWKIKTKSGKGGKVVEKSLQKELNRLVFGSGELPSLLERFESSSAKERENLKEIAKSWLQLKIKGIKDKENIQGMKTTTNFSVGGLYFYVYDAKHKAVLPYWDAFPMTIPLETYSDGFLGMNLHYLPEEIRVKFLSNLISSFGQLGGSGDRALKLAVSYGIVSTFDRKNLSPCIKRYLYNHIKSKILPVESYEWAYAVYMPVAQINFNQLRK